MRTKDIAIIGGVAALLGGGALLAMRKGPGQVKVGQKFTANVSFWHKGPATRYWAGFGFIQPLSISINVIRGEIIAFYHQEVNTEGSSQWRQYSASVATTIPQLQPGDYDAFVFLQKAEGSLSKDGYGFLDSRVYADVIKLGG
mgnify:CR=1 FL=1